MGVIKPGDYVDVRMVAVDVAGDRLVVRFPDQSAVQQFIQDRLCEVWLQRRPQRLRVMENAKLLLVVGFRANLLEGRCCSGISER